MKAHQTQRTFAFLVIVAIEERRRKSAQQLQVAVVGVLQSRDQVQHEGCGQDAKTQTQPGQLLHGAIVRKAQEAEEVQGQSGTDHDPEPDEELPLDQSPIHHQISVAQELEGQGDLRESQGPPSRCSTSFRCGAVN